MSCNPRIGRDTSYILVSHKDGSFFFRYVMFLTPELLPYMMQTIHTESIKKEERELLFSYENIFILKLMVNMRKCFKNGYLQKVDKSNALVSCVCGIADTTANEVSSSKIHEADAFLNSLKLDSNGNLLSDVPPMGKSTLCYWINTTNQLVKKNKVKFWHRQKKISANIRIWYLSTLKKKSKINLETIHIIIAGQL